MANPTLRPTLQPGPAPPLPEVEQPQRRRILRVAFLVSSDLAWLLAAWTAAYFLWAKPVHGGGAGLYLDLTPLALLFVLGYARTGLYPGFGLGPVETLRRLSYVTVFGFIVLTSAGFVMQLPHVYSRITFALAGLLSLVFVPMGRFALGRLAERSAWWSEPVVVIGTGERARAAIRALGRMKGMGYRPWAALSLPSAAPAPEEVAGVPVAGSVDRVGEAAELGIVIALLEPDEGVDATTLDELQGKFRHVVMLGRFADLPVEGVEIRNLGGSLGIEYTNNLLKWHNRAFKRGVDIVLGSLLLALSLPLLGAAALAVRSAGPGPVLYRQKRTGLDGAELLVTKFRTMRVGAERELERYLDARPDLRIEWEQRKKLPDDPRILPVVGPFLRRWSIDELPQLWSVVRGRMSLVGPRPLPEYHLEGFTPSFRRLRQRVRPGLTGMWQVMIRSDGDLEQQQALDSYYIRNWSFWLDLHLLGKTAAAVWSGRGAY